MSPASSVGLCVEFSVRGAKCGLGIEPRHWLWDRPGNASRDLELETLKGFRVVSRNQSTEE